MLRSYPQRTCRRLAVGRTDGSRGAVGGQGPKPCERGDPSAGTARDLCCGAESDLGFKAVRWRWGLAMGMVALEALAGEACWPQFRGPGASGVAPSDRLPTTLGLTTNLWWKQALPSGHSSPCIWGDALFVTAYAEPELQVLGFDARTGELRWRKGFTPPKVERGSGLSNPAAPTPCTDGERVISYFGPLGAVCHDFAGEELWRRELPEPSTQHGVGSSPVLAGDRVLLLRDQDVGSHLLALDLRTGAEVWRVERRDFRRGFCTPLLVPGDDEPLVVAPGTLRVVFYRARDGAERWTVPGLPNEICASPIAGPGWVYCGGWTPGSGSATMPSFEDLLREGDRNQDGQLARDEAPQGPAKSQFHYIDADRDGKLTRAEYEFIADVFQRSWNAVLAIRTDPDFAPEPRVLWRHERGLPYVPTPLLYRDRLYLLKNGGLLTSLNATNGSVVIDEERIGVMGDNYASPVAADGKLVVASQSGTVALLAAGDAVEVLAKASLGEPILATPAIAHHALYVRSQRHLWAFKANPPDQEAAPGSHPSPR